MYFNDTFFFFSKFFDGRVDTAFQYDKINKIKEFISCFHKA
ncbi:hypothetical protein HMPREF0369_02557 [Anaerostipes hadrus ATCC 29173 = JCM 17467]|nr:hypothetical protein CLOSS21_01940 [Clostridium sp. SS2/1]EKY19449.1 hypothetical protein HMPREF0369_02557 [Anaerostipes hadrus ATCC 29173 = JCM 17467]